MAHKIQGIPPGDLSAVPPYDFINLLPSMIRRVPEQRPTAGSILHTINFGIGNVDPDHAWYGRISSCCIAERERYQVAEEDTVFNAYKFEGDIGKIN